MSVKDLFENCGYKLYANNDKLICYTHGDGKRIKFKLKQRKLTLHTDVDMELLKAINCQCYLLGWLGDNNEMRKLRTL